MRMSTISNWNDLTVKDLQEIHRINTMEDRDLRIAALFAGITYEELLDMPLNKVSEMVERIKFLATPIPKVRVKRKYEVNGRTYKLIKDTGEMTVSQFIEFQGLAADGFDKHLPELLGVMLQGDYEEKDEDMKDFSVVEALAIADFFTKRSEKLMRLSLTYLKASLWLARKRARKIKDKEMREALELEIQLMQGELK